MAAAVAATVYLFLFTFSSAQLSFGHQHNDFFSADPSLLALADSDPKPGAALLLPSERPENEPATFVQVEPEESGSKLRQKKQDERISVSQSDSFPLTTVITLRPINRHFSRVPISQVRRGFKCHGRRRRNNHIHQIKQRFAGQGKIPFGNDVILAKDRDLGFDPSYTGEVQRLERWEKYGHGGDRIRLSNDDAMREEMYGLYRARPHFHHHHRRHPHEEEEEDDEEETHNHESENGIINGIRRFFNF